MTWQQKGFFCSSVVYQKTTCLQRNRKLLTLKNSSDVQVISAPDVQGHKALRHCPTLQKKASFLPQVLCFPFYNAPVDHISLASCIKMAEQGGQVCLKKQLKELSLYWQLLSSSALLTWDWSAAAGLLVPFVPASNPIWAGKEREFQPKVVHSLIIFVFLVETFLLLQAGAAPTAQLCSNSNQIQHLK